MKPSRLILTGQASKWTFNDFGKDIFEISQKSGAEPRRLFIEIMSRRFEFALGFRQYVKFHADCSLACRAFKSAITSAAPRATVVPAR